MLIYKGEGLGHAHKGKKQERLNVLAITGTNRKINDEKHTQNQAFTHTYQQDTQAAKKTTFRANYNTKRTKACVKQMC